MDFSRLAIIFGGLALAAVIVAVMLLLRSQRQSVTLPVEAVVVIRPNTDALRVPVEMARTSAEKIQGLSDREALPKDGGMLFVWDVNIQSGFSMRRMRFSLDIIFVQDTGDGEARIVSIERDLPPCPNKIMGCATASSPESFRYVLEVPGGFAAAHGIAIGDTFKLDIAR